MTTSRAEGEGLEPLGVTPARFSKPVADHSAPPSLRGGGGIRTRDAFAYSH